MEMWGYVIVLLSCICIDGTFIETSYDSEREYVCGEQGDYTEDSGNGQILSHMGLLEGHNYGKNLRCIWNIAAPEGMFVEISSDNFTVESSDKCGYDYVELFDGNSTTSRSIGKLCGYDFITMTSTQRYMTILFVTDQSTQMEGFVLSYNFTTIRIHACMADEWMCDNGHCIEQPFYCDHEDDCGDDSDEATCNDCAETQFQCASGDKCVPPVWQCDGFDDCGDNSDEEECPTVTPATPDETAVSETCVGDLYRNATSGNITTPNYPEHYPLNLQCDYTIDVGEDSAGILIIFNDNFGLEKSDNCIYDMVTITGETSDDTEQVYGPFCGYDSPGSFNITGSSVRVSFVSDTSQTNYGFRLEWQAYD